MCPLSGRLDKHPSPTRPFRPPGRLFILWPSPRLGHRRDRDSAGVDPHAPAVPVQAALREEPYRERQGDILLLEGAGGAGLLPVVPLGRPRFLYDDGPPVPGRIHPIEFAAADYARS